MDKRRVSGNLAGNQSPAKSQSCCEPNIVNLQMSSHPTPPHQPGRATVDVTVRNRLGLHTHPVAMIAKCCGKFQSVIYFEKDGEEVSSNSVLGICMLAAHCGSVVTITAVGDDCSEAIRALVELFDSKFGED